MLQGDVIEDNAKEHELAFWIQKQTRFAQRQVVAEMVRDRMTQPRPVAPAFFGTPDQRTLWFKMHWYRMPRYWRAFPYFLYRYLFRLGFPGRKCGLLYHFTQAWLYRVMVDARIEEPIDLRYPHQSCQVMRRLSAL